MICTNKIKRGHMSEPRQCMREKHAWGEKACTPNLLGMQFGNFLVIALAPPVKYACNKHMETVWRVRHVINGQEREIRAFRLIRGDATGNHKIGFCTYNGKPQPEYRTVQSHYRLIFKPHIEPNRAKYYKDMPFYDDWNPDKGGAFWKGTKWILENLGSKPGPNWSMDIIQHDVGFVPGNLRWACKRTQKRNQQHRILGQFSEEEFDVEAKRRGYTKIVLDKPIETVDASD